ncbi:LLM class F420-dependent oxidoreductase [Pseudonocardiaceae bacterium YIM PH 21723]|nr:LLM class F420-dependent oxidoreductase [Pseudonocardiaceae bacterium YIM PH 21723]
MGTFGVWASGSAFEGPEGVAAIREAEQLGYDTFWISDAPDMLSTARTLLDATSTIRVGTSIVNIWNMPVADVNRRFPELATDRFLLGVGAGHRERNDGYTSPFDALTSFVDELVVPKERRFLAALGPKVLQLAGERAAGAIPYLTTPEHTARAREILGPDPFLGPEHAVILNEDPVQARALGRQFVGIYLTLRNYTNNLLRLGFTEADLADGGSDRLVDELVYWGSPQQVAAKLRRHHEAGADHVAIQFLTPDRGLAPDQTRLLAPALF